MGTETNREKHLEETLQGGKKPLPVINILREIRDEEEVKIGFCKRHNQKTKKRI